VNTIVLNFSFIWLWRNHLESSYFWIGNCLSLKCYWSDFDVVLHGNVWLFLGLMWRWPVTSGAKTDATVVYRIPWVACYLLVFDFWLFTVMFFSHFHSVFAQTDRQTDRHTHTYTEMLQNNTLLCQHGWGVGMLTHSWTSIHCYVLIYTDLLLINLVTCPLAYWTHHHGLSCRYNGFQLDTYWPINEK